ncbi:hypothetical protein M011DRAFT_466529 [Sporormia fimetaria CBS 119925]|uniref:Uncharacterized protein n=1 Tax=Sporormia fimetaria CBS 119925 TaxID=1340428 RepID=A0A6A6VEU9_9PLEO|nr:hypothetical protein M011DRAFT_466529 [Sporormia fimetaria CBS 119925]
MVGAINPVSPSHSSLPQTPHTNHKTQTSSSQLQRQQTLALDSSYQLNPGDPFPAESTPTDTPGPGFTGPSLPLISSPADVTRVKITPATIGGITVAVVGVLILVGIMVFYLGRIKMLKEEVARKNSTLLRGDLSTDPERGGDNMTQTTVSPHMASVTPIAGAVTPHNTTQESKTDNFFQPPGHLRFASPGPPPPTYDAHYYSNEIAATPYGAKERALHPVYRTEPSVAQLYAQAQMPRRNKSLRDLGGDV